MRLITFLISIILCSQALAVEHKKWEQGAELQFNLTVGEERKIHFPEPVFYGKKASHQANFSLSLISNVAFVTARQEFSDRVVFRGITSQTSYIIKMSGSNDAGVLDREMRIHKGEIPSDAEGVVKESINSSKKLSMIDLVQFASQTLFAPDELIEPAEGLRRVKVKQVKLPRLYANGKVESEVIASWSGGGMYVTAVHLRNTSELDEVFSACNIRGDFLSASAQYRSMIANSTNDFTVAYLVSDKPFFEAVKRGVIKCR